MRQHRRKVAARGTSSQDNTFPWIRKSVKVCGTVAEMLQHTIAVQNARGGRMLGTQAVFDVQNYATQVAHEESRVDFLVAPVALVPAAFVYEHDHGEAGVVGCC